MGCCGGGMSGHRRRKARRRNQAIAEWTAGAKAWSESYQQPEHSWRHNPTPEMVAAKEEAYRQAYREQIELARARGEW
ncbi:hypothetical protein FLONG3_5060 [Fusarium longipes]|uniref:Uncharacterized protein n=1 Tax=Fusarium longipes TaxID=694270 RepID=A0A395SX65_9HYPO|nr:hypothetical protein FLONG3_5060 [Fusarium longipes]